MREYEYCADASDTIHRSEDCPNFEEEPKGWGGRSRALVGLSKGEEGLCTECLTRSERQSLFRDAARTFQP